MKRVGGRAKNVAMNGVKFKSGTYCSLLAIKSDQRADHSHFTGEVKSFKHT